jgi:purine-nucleoside/S-methyl-5'-thioadenosine phosphorylase / adenosine deaminase
LSNEAIPLTDSLPWFIVDDMGLEITMKTGPGPRDGSNQDVALVCHQVDHSSAVMAFSLRAGGCSPPPLDSLNFSVTQGDTSENVACNFAVLGKRLGIDPGKVVTVRQVHGDTIHVARSADGLPIDADAIIATEPEIFPAVKTADCLPILILDPVRRVSAAVHAGWRGTVLRITRKVVQALSTEFRCNPEDLTVALGPAIGTCCYEVDDAVLVPFRRGVPDAERFIAVHRSMASGGNGTKQSFRLDLTAANLHELTSVGIPEENIIKTDLCTACREDLFFSHRRDGLASGRHIAVTGFRE